MNANVIYVCKRKCNFVCNTITKQLHSQMQLQSPFTTCESNGKHNPNFVNTAPTANAIIVTPLVAHLFDSSNVAQRSSQIKLICWLVFVLDAVHPIVPLPFPIPNSWLFCLTLSSQERADEWCVTDAFQGLGVPPKTMRQQAARQDRQKDFEKMKMSECWPHWARGSIGREAWGVAAVRWPTTASGRRRGQRHRRRCQRGRQVLHRVGQSWCRSIVKCRLALSSTESWAGQIWVCQER